MEFKKAFDYIVGKVEEELVKRICKCLKRKITVLVGKGGKADHNNRNHCENNHPDYVGNRGLA